MILNGNDKLENALADVLLCSDPTWGENELQRRNQNLMRNYKFMQNVLEDKTTDGDEKEAPPGTRRRTVRQTIPFSRLAKYGNYEYDEALERVHDPPEPPQYETDCPRNECTEPWMLQEVEELFKNYTSETAGQYRAYAPSCFGSHLHDPWREPAEEAPSAFYESGGSLPRYGASGGGRYTSKEEEDLHRLVHSDELSRLWREDERPPSPPPPSTTHRRTPRAGHPPSPSRAWHPEFLPPPPDPSPGSPASPQRFNPAAPAWIPAPYADDDARGPLFGHECCAANFDPINADVLDTSFASSSSSLPMHQYYFPSSSESTFVDELFPYGETPGSSPVGTYSAYNGYPSCQIPVIYSGAENPPRPPPGFTKKIPVFQRPTEFYANNFEKRRHGAVFNNLIYLPKPGDKENQKQEMYSALLRVPLTETTTTHGMSSDEEFSIATKSAEAFDRKFPPLPKATDKKEEVPLFGMSTLFEGKDFFHSTSKTSALADSTYSLPLMPALLNDDFPSLPKTPIPGTSDHSCSSQSPPSAAQDGTRYSDSSPYVNQDPPLSQETPFSERPQTPPFDQQGATTTPTAEEWFSETYPNPTEMDDQDPACGSPSASLSFASHEMWLNHHYSRRVDTFHHMHQLTDELTTIEHQLDEELKQHLKAYEEVEESKSNQLELEKDFPPITGTPKRVQKRRKKPNDMLQSPESVQSSASTESLRTNVLEFGLNCRRSYKDVCANSCEIQHTYDPHLEFPYDTEPDCGIELLNDTNEPELSWVDNLLENNSSPMFETHEAFTHYAEVLEMYRAANAILQSDEEMVKVREENASDEQEQQVDVPTLEDEQSTEITRPQVFVVEPTAETVVFQTVEGGGGEVHVESVVGEVQVEGKERGELDEPTERVDGKSDDIEGVEAEKKIEVTKEGLIVKLKEKQKNDDVACESFQQPGSSPSKLSDENIALKYQELEEHALGKQKCRKSKEMTPKASPETITQTLHAKLKETSCQIELRCLTTTETDKGKRGPTSTDENQSCPAAMTPPRRGTPGGASCRRKLVFILPTKRDATSSTDEGDEEGCCPRIVAVRDRGLLVQSLGYDANSPRASPRTCKILSPPLTSNAGTSNPAKNIPVRAVLSVSAKLPPIAIPVSPSNNIDSKVKSTWMKQQRKKSSGKKKQRSRPKAATKPEPSYWERITSEVEAMERFLESGAMYVLRRRSGERFADNFSQTDYEFPAAVGHRADLLSTISARLDGIERRLARLDDGPNIPQLGQLSAGFLKLRDQAYQQSETNANYAVCKVARLAGRLRGGVGAVEDRRRGLVRPLDDEYAKMIVRHGRYPGAGFVREYLDALTRGFRREKAAGIYGVDASCAVRMTNRASRCVGDVLEMFCSLTLPSDSESQGHQASQTVDDLAELKDELFRPEVALCGCPKSGGDVPGLETESLKTTPISCSCGLDKYEVEGKPTEPVNNCLNTFVPSLGNLGPISIPALTRSEYLMSYASYKTLPHSARSRALVTPPQIATIAASKPIKAAETNFKTNSAAIVNSKTPTQVASANHVKSGGNTKSTPTELVVATEAIPAQVQTPNHAKSGGKTTTTPTKHVVATGDTPTQVRTPNHEKSVWKSTAKPTSPVVATKATPYHTTSGGKTTSPANATTSPVVASKTAPIQVATSSPTKSGGKTTVYPTKPVVATKATPVQSATPNHTKSVVKTTPVVATRATAIQAATSNHAKSVGKTIPQAATKATIPYHAKSVGKTTTISTTPAVTWVTPAQARTPCIKSVGKTMAKPNTPVVATKATPAQVRTPNLTRSISKTTAKSDTSPAATPALTARTKDVGPLPTKQDEAEEILNQTADRKRISRSASASQPEASAAGSAKPPAARPAPLHARRLRPAACGNAVRLPAAAASASCPLIRPTLTLADSWFESRRAPIERGQRGAVGPRGEGPPPPGVHTPKKPNETADRGASLVSSGGVLPRGVKRGRYEGGCDASRRAEDVLVETPPPPEQDTSTRKPEVRPRTFRGFLTNIQRAMTTWRPREEVACCNRTTSLCNLCQPSRKAPALVARQSVSDSSAPCNTSSRAVPVKCIAGIPGYGDPTKSVAANCKRTQVVPVTFKQYQAPSQTCQPTRVIPDTRKQTQLVSASCSSGLSTIESGELKDSEKSHVNSNQNSTLEPTITLPANVVLGGNCRQAIRQKANVQQVQPAGVHVRQTKVLKRSKKSVAVNLFPSSNEDKPKKEPNSCCIS